MKSTIMFPLFLTIVIFTLFAGCSKNPNDHSSEENPGEDTPSVPVFTAAMVDPTAIDYIDPLGALGPPGHTFPTDHMYFYLQPGASEEVTIETGLFAPGDMQLVEARAYQHVNAGFTDFAITLQKGDVFLELGHVTTLAENIFGRTDDFSGWTLQKEYTTGGETYRSYGKQFNLSVKAGDSLGTVGGNPGQYALDVGAYDIGKVNGTVANPDRWKNSRYANAVCPLSFYQQGALLDTLLGLLNRDKDAQDEHPCGQVLQDVPGTAQGCWFLKGVTDTYPEDNHLALARDHRHPSRAAISAGAQIATLPAGLYEFTPQSSGLLNRAFDQISADGKIYGFTPDELSQGVIIISMPDANSLWIEHLPAGTNDPAGWSFTAAHTEFVR